MPSVADFEERELIARLRAQLQSSPSWLVVGIGDDAAVVEHERNHLEVLTVDAIVEGVHFDRAFTPPDAIGHRAIAVNLSDLAAMGARPRLALLSMALPAALDVADFDAIVGGIVKLASRHGLHVIGGNLTKSPGPLVIDVTAVGVARRRQVLARSGARPGDELWLTGALGAAAAGLEMLRAPGTAITRDAAPVQRYLYPVPQVRAGLLAGRSRSASACMDLSDGLLDALQQMSQASSVGVQIDATAVPVDATASAWWRERQRDPLSEAARGGDDYELLFAVPRRRRRAFLDAMTRSGVEITRIGQCVKESGIAIGGRAVDTSERPAFRHFR